MFVLFFVHRRNFQDVTPSIDDRESEGELISEEQRGQNNDGINMKWVIAGEKLFLAEKLTDPW